VHLERTLDEAYFPGLNAAELKARNLDQVVSSECKGRSGLSEEDIPILIVPQLWLWRFGTLVISAHGTRDNMTDIPCTVVCAELQLALMVANCIKHFGEELVLANGTKIPPTLDLFECKIISILAEVKAYITHTKGHGINYDEEVKFHHVLSDCRSELAMIQHFLQQQEELVDKLRHYTCKRNDKEEEVLLPVNKEASLPEVEEASSSEGGQASVSEDEEASLSAHEEVSSQEDGEFSSPENDKVPTSNSSKPSYRYRESAMPMMRYRKILHTHEGLRPIADAQRMIKEYQKRVQKIDGDAERIEKNVQDLLDLKRTYASVQMSQASVKDTHASVVLSVAAIGFAVVTIIFAPLAFLVGLFALDFQGFDSLRVNPRGDGNDRADAARNSDDGRNITVSVVSKNDPAYHGGKMAGIFSELHSHGCSCFYVALRHGSWHGDCDYSDHMRAGVDVHALVRYRIQ
jgi:hypothetical protein